MSASGSSRRRSSWPPCGWSPCACRGTPCATGSCSAHRRLGVRRVGSAGYAFTALFTMQGLSLQSLVETQVLRGVLTPVGHGLWTAVLGGVLFRGAARAGRLRLSGGLVGWYVVVALLHALWDASQGHRGLADPAADGHPGPMVADPDGPGTGADPGQVHAFTIISWGCCWLMRCWAWPCCAAAGGRRWLWSASSQHLDAVLAELDQGGRRPGPASKGMRQKPGYRRHPPGEGTPDPQRSKRTAELFSAVRR